ncbi:unnamed protein product [Owenia fusiformis]|uniref:Uncharacterized protein n=1 Tax=Owenia fusiformis TaxID=6347 RepID=A0A8J1XMK7_OWEFU|nr:unnamed protein product [Owenia fusiformis]
MLLAAFRKMDFLISPNFLHLSLFLVATLTFFCSSCVSLENENTATFKIEGKVNIPFTTGQEWLTHTRILLDGGEKMIGFLKSDGTFVVNNLAPGSYLVQVENPDYAFEPCRVDITSKGKIRARKMNNVQTSAVQSLPYPLRFKARAQAPYFQQREQWRITDMLMNPMVLMMVLPVLLLMVLPKMMNAADPETQKEMQNSMSMFSGANQKSAADSFDLSKSLTGLFGTTSPTSKKRKNK